MEQQAGPAELFVRGEFRWRTGADRERAQQEVERVADGPRMGIGAKVLHAFALRTAHHHRTRPDFIKRDSHKRIALVIH